MAQVVNIQGEKDSLEDRMFVVSAALTLSDGKVEQIPIVWWLKDITDPLATCQLFQQLIENWINVVGEVVRQGSNG